MLPERDAYRAVTSVRRIASRYGSCPGRRLAGPGVRDQVADGVALEGAWIPVGVGDREIGGFVDAALGHADVAQRQLGVQLLGEIVEAPCRIRRADRARDPRH